MFNRTDSEIIELFNNAETREDIADVLEISEKSLRYFLFVKRTENMYNTFSIPKKHGGTRQIFAPFKELRNIQRKLAYILNLIYKPKVCAYGFIKNKNMLGNAAQHTKRFEILNIDLKDFFTQFHFGRVVGLLKSKPYMLGEDAAITVAQIVCLNGVLPQGAPTSPILTNMLCTPLDNQLMQYAKRHSLVYTRYADDITLSSFNRNISENIINITKNRITLSDSLKKIFDKHNLTINENKIVFRTKYTRQEVTGIIVNRFPNVKREYYKNLRAILHNCKITGVYNEAIKYIENGYCKNKNIIAVKDNLEYKDMIEKWFESVLTGKILFIKQVKGTYSFTFYSLAQAANDIFSKLIFDLSYFDRMNDIIDKNVFVIQNKEETNQGTGFYVPNYGLFTSYHVTEDKDFYYLFKNSAKVISTPIGVEINKISDDKTIDYALYNISIPDSAELSIGRSEKLKVGDTVITAGFPDYLKGDTITREECKITGITQFFGSPFYKVSARIVHGASGGIVLNTDHQVVGIIKGGCSSNEENNNSIKQGFVPIDLVIENLKLKNVIDKMY